MHGLMNMYLRFAVSCLSDRQLFIRELALCIVIVYVSDTVVEKKSQIGKVFILATLIILICLIFFAGWKNGKQLKGLKLLNRVDS